MKDVEYNFSSRDLMIGDWVKWRDNGEYYIISEISETTDDEATVCFMGHNYMVNIDEIEPVPLNPEILKKNGFFCYSDNGKCWRYNFVDANGNPLDGIYINADFETKEPFTAVSNRCYHAAPFCMCVHQLQHALRLCGIYVTMKV